MNEEQATAQRRAAEGGGAQWRAAQSDPQHSGLELDTLVTIPNTAKGADRLHCVFLAQASNFPETPLINSQNKKKKNTSICLVYKQN